MKHTFFMEEGRWQADGIYVSADGTRCPLVGETRMVHGDEAWHLDGVMKVIGDTTCEFRNRYEMMPWIDEAGPIPWSSDNPKLGRVEGKFVAVGEAVMSEYKTTDGAYSGLECLVEMGDGTYTAAGALYDDQGCLGSWQATLVRQQT